MNRVEKFQKRTIRKAPLAGKTVLVRVDYNVPLNEDGTIADDFRIRASLDTLEHLLRDRCKIVLISHLGRPDGPSDLKYSLESVAKRLSELVDRPVSFIPDCVGPKVRAAVKQAPQASLILLENLRFYSQEESNDAEFARKLAHDSMAAYFVQDAFGVVHRAHASTAAITEYLPSLAGLLVEREYTTITAAMKSPKRPLLAILGGAKVSDKIPVIEALTKVADQIVIGGAMANTFLSYSGKKLGNSKVEEGQEAVIDDIYKAVDRKVSPHFRDNFLLLPTDLAVTREVSKTAKRRTVMVDEVGHDDIALDIGEQSIERMVAAIERAQTVIWNGTLGMAEFDEFAHGSARAALALAQNPRITSIIGGGDTADFVINWDGAKGGSFTHVSTGGGASLELMSGEKLPGIESLLDA